MLQKLVLLKTLSMYTPLIINLCLKNFTYIPLQDFFIQ